VIENTRRKHLRNPWAWTALAAMLLMAGCSHTPRQESAHATHAVHWRPHWPWHRAPAAPEPPVSELVVDGTGGASAPMLMQTWDRNTLRISLEGLAGAGELKLVPVQGHGWPIRLEFAVQPGSFQQLEVRGEQRVVLVVPATGGVAVLPVPQGLYAPTTQALTLRYGSGSP
jgi:hypothetical protein